MEENTSEKDYLFFKGIRCCLFDLESAGQAQLRMNFKMIRDFGDTVYNPDGSVKHYLHTWDDGYRILVQCQKCGAIFIVQSSEYHGKEDSYYRDWYQVEDEKRAIIINNRLDGWGIENKYNAPWIKATNDVIAWNKQ